MVAFNDTSKDDAWDYIKGYRDCINLIHFPNFGMNVRKFYIFTVILFEINQNQLRSPMLESGEP
jgi:hypothetical protein